MAGSLPTPRSYQSILGDMIDAFLSRYGGKQLKVGGPLLSIFESAAQNDVRGTQDIFNLLDATDVDRATGVALDRIAAGEDMARKPTTPSTGLVNIFDTSFAAITTKVYPGAAAPNAGTIILKVADASSMPSTGSLYLGRGTVNYEGPITFSAPTQVGTYWTVTLGTPTQKFHDVNETVTLAQGGNRVIPAGSIVQTAQGNVANAVQFTTLSVATILDGDIEVDGVGVVCQSNGVIGNVQKDAIQDFASKPFTGASVSNPQPYNNGRPTEDDSSLRERIKQTRQSRSLGTPLALIINSVGVTSTTENKTVISASVFQPQGEPATLFIDDGTGYEEINEGVALETLMDAALGGESRFRLNGGELPVSKAFVATTLTAPFALTAGSQLAVEVGGVLTTHTFSTFEFRSISNATAFEVVAAINGDSNLLFSARTAGNGTQVVLFSRAELNEDVEVVTPGTGTNANTWLGFPTGVNYTLRLYKNDRLLYKDGKSAIILSAPQSQWSATITDGVYLKIKVDGTPATVYKFVNQDFVNAATGYTTVNALNSLAAWASVLNTKIPGITASVASGQLSLVSNRAANDASGITISQPTSSDYDPVTHATIVDPTKNLVQLGMFTAGYGLSSAGRSNDYTLNRNTGELKLTSLLVVSDSLSAGSLYTRAYQQGAEISSGTITLGSNANLWVVVDGAAQTVQTSVNAGTSFTITNPSGQINRYTATTAVFQNLQIGDWVIIWDPTFTTQGAWRVSKVDASFFYFDVERATTFVSQVGVSPTSNGMVFVRTSAKVQQITVPSGGSLALSSIATTINTQLLGATASVYRNVHLRITTNTFGSNGDIFVATVDATGQAFGLTSGVLEVNESSHLPAIESANKEAGTPNFNVGTISTIITQGTHVTTSIVPDSTGSIMGWLRRTQVAGEGYGNSTGLYSPIKDQASGDVELMNSISGMTVGDRIFFRSTFKISPDDNLTVVVDNLASTKNYNIQMFRNAKPQAGQVWTSTGLKLLDADNSNSDFSTAFGTTDTNFFQNFALHMHARGKSHGGSGGSAPANYHFNKALLWRFARFGPDGNVARVAYVNPTAPSQVVSVATANGLHADINVTLPSDVARTGLNLFATTKFTVAVSAGSPADTVTYSYSSPTVSLQRVSNVTTGTTTGNHGFAIGDVVYITGNVDFSTGAKTVVSVPTGTTFTYNDPGVDVGPDAGLTVSSAVSSPSFASVVAGDIVNIGTGSGFSTAHQGAFMVVSKTATSFTIRRLTGAVSAVTTPVSINGVTNIQFFPIKTANSTASAIATVVNTSYSGVVTAVAVENGGGSPGAGTITMATLEEYLAGYGNTTAGTPTQAWTLADGINWVQSCNLAASPATFVLKNGPSSDLTSNADFDNETFKLVPILTPSLVSYLTSPAVSGFYAGADIVASSRAGKLQFSSKTSGSSGAIQVTGGSASVAGAAIVGSGSVVDTSFSKVQIAASQAKGLMATQWCAIQATNSQQKSVAITGSSVLQSVVASGGNWIVTFDGATPLWTLHQSVPTTDTLTVDKAGNFVFYALSATALSGPVVGDWVHINVAALNPVNNGYFRVVAINGDNSGFWVENTSGTSETQAMAGGDVLKFYSYDSVMPGDKLVIDTTIFGTANKGSFTVVEDFTSQFAVQVIGTMAAYSSGSALGTNSAFVRFLEALPLRIIKKIWTINQSSTNSSFMDVVFVGSELAAKMSSGAAAAILPLDKLSFASGLVSGADAYSYSAGLIGEVNKAMYGDPSNPSVYPGVVAAGARVNISGPLIKRIQVGLAIRIRTGATEKNVRDRVKSAVAAFINSVPQEKPVALSSIVTAAQGVDGVVAVTILSPTYSSGNDLIPVQAGEKPRVLNVDQDILVSVVGQ